METRYVNVPIAGCLKHGIQENNRPKELGYFIAKVQEVAMQHLAKKFEELYNKQKEIVIYIYSEDAYSVKRVKRNQSGTVCYCLNNSNKAKERVNKKWIEKDCLENCESRQAKNDAKPMCQEELTLKFLIPNISKDRVWIFQSRSYNTLKNISSYIELQKQLGNPIKGYYKLFLFQKDSEKNGKIFKNYVADIVKIEETDLKPNAEANNSKEKEIEPSNNKEDSNVIDLANTTTTKETKKAKTKTSKKPEVKKEEKSDEELLPTKENMEKYYLLLETSQIELNKQGKQVTYTKGKFVNQDSKEFEIILNPSFAEEVSMCQFGSQFLLDTQEVGGKLFATKCHVIKKQLKEAV